MPWTPVTFGGALVWVDNQAPALDAANLNLQESEEAAYAVQLAQSVVNYFELQPSGGDDTVAINSAAANGTRLGSGTFKISGKLTVPFRGSDSGKTLIHCTSAGAGIQWGNPLGQAPVDVSGTYGGFTIDGQGLSTMPFSCNTVNGIYVDVTAIGGTASAVGVYGQNNIFNKLGADSVVLDNGCGGNVFSKPEIHGPAPVDLIIIQQSVAPPEGSYPYPSYNFFRDGIAEFTGTTKSCLRKSAGVYIYFDDFNFFTNSIVPLVNIDPNGGVNALVNDALYFNDCGWTGNGFSTSVPSSTNQFGIQCINASGGVAQALPGGDVPVILRGQNVFSGLDHAVNWGVTNEIWNQGINRFYSGTQDFRQAATNAPITYNYGRENDQAVSAFLNGWANYGGGIPGAVYYREGGRVYLSGAIGAGTLAQPAFQLPPGYRPGGYKIFNPLGARVDVDTSGNVTPQSGSNALLSLDGISFVQGTY